MNGRGKVRYVFASSNTGQGFYTFIPELIAGLEQVYILKGAAGTGKSTFIRLMGESLNQLGYEVEFWLSAFDAISPEGVYIPQLQAAVVNGSLSIPIDPDYPGAREIIINLNDYADKAIIKSRHHVIFELVQQFKQHQQEGLNALKDVARFQEEVKKPAALRLNLDKVNRLVGQLDLAIMSHPAAEKHYFANVVTGAGMVNYLDEVSGDCSKRYIFKGPAGSGKSTVIRELAYRARQNGCRLEYYHGGIEPENLVMVIVRDLQVALIDAGNIEIRVQPWDIIIDMKECLDGNDSDYNDLKSSENMRRLESLRLTAENEFKAAEAAMKQLKKIYTAAMDFAALESKRGEITEAIRRPV